MKRIVAALGVLVVLALPARAVMPDEVLKDPALEQRARTISKELRCLVCQNQSIDDSDADLAKDLRVLVRERLTEGDSDQQVLDYLVARYGEFVLLKPRLEAQTLLLWASPALLVVLGGIAIWRRNRSVARQPKATSLSAEEEARLSALLDDKPVS